MPLSAETLASVANGIKFRAAARTVWTLTQAVDGYSNTETVTTFDDAIALANNDQRQASGTETPLVWTANANGVIQATGSDGLIYTITCKLG